MPEVDNSFFSYQQASPKQALDNALIKGIALDPSVGLKVANRIQEYYYQQGFLTLFRLEPTPEASGCYRLGQHRCSKPLDAASATIQTPDGIYPFVIIETAQGLDLRIGLGGHYHTADKAMAVIAAGDLYFTPHGSHGGFLSKITNQSGSYHITAEDSLETQRYKYQASLEAMQIVGLPMQQFQPYQEPVSQSLFFGSHSHKPSSYGTTQPGPCDSPKSKCHPCTDAEPRALQLAL